jgi:hypothetical protein
VSGVAVIDESPGRGREIAAAAPKNVFRKSLRLEKSMDLKFILKYLIWQGYAVAGLAALLGPDVKQMKIRRYSPPLKFLERRGMRPLKTLFSTDGIAAVSGRYFSFLWRGRHCPRG